jgi:signal transduction histidine kinase
MTEVINNMFVLSSVAFGRAALNLERLELDELVRNVVRKMHDLLESVGSSAEILSDGPVYGYWDRNRIEQVLVNLLSNAARYGAGQPITISIGVEPGFAVVSVQDRGVGIAHDEQDKIFEPFRRKEDAHAGLGVGLFVCRVIVEAHSGRISVSSEEGMGALFQVRLPLPPEGDPTVNRLPS